MRAEDGDADRTRPGRRSRTRARAGRRPMSFIRPISFSRPTVTVLQLASSRISKLARRWSQEVLGLVAHAPGVVLGRLDDLAGPLLGGPHDLGALHHPLGLDPAGVEHLVGLPAGLGDELLALLEHPAGLAQLVGQPVERLLEQLDDLVAVDHAATTTAASCGAVAMMSMARRSSVSASPTCARRGSGARSSTRRRSSS